MPRALDISNVERTFISDALSQGVRIDGRAFDQFRKIELDFAEEYGTATVTLGKTRFVQARMASGYHQLIEV